MGAVMSPGAGELFSNLDEICASATANVSRATMIPMNTRLAILSEVTGSEAIGGQIAVHGSSLLQIKDVNIYDVFSFLTIILSISNKRYPYPYCRSVIISKEYILIHLKYIPL